MTQPLSPLQHPGLGISGWQGPLQALRPFSPSLRHESCSCLVQRRAKPRAWMRTLGLSLLCECFQFWTTGHESFISPHPKFL